jgi:hypothetical protein
MLARQGDVLIEKVDSYEVAEIVQPVDGRIILAHGEATGHHHSLPCADVADASIDETGAIFLRAIRETVVTHQEHAPITLEPGSYRVTRQREYHPEEIRNVQD